MKNRLERFHDFKNHTWFGKSYAKLNKKHLEFAEAWIKEHDYLEENGFITASTIMGLDRPNLRAAYKNFDVIQELMSSREMRPK